MMTALSVRFEKALQYAIRVHKGHKRKGAGTEIPYVSHLLAVASIVLDHGGTEDEAIAALLHDAPEDQGGQIRLDEIGLEFGAEVASIVKGCSETMERPKPAWKIRKDGYIAHIAGASKSVQLVSAADKLHNVRALLSDYNTKGEKLWEAFNAPKEDQLWFYRTLVREFKKAGSNKLVDELDRMVDQFVELVKNKNR